MARSALKGTYLGVTYARPRATMSGSNRRLKILLLANAASGGSVDGPLAHGDGTRHTGPDGSEILCLEEGWGFPTPGGQPRLDEREDPLRGTVMWEPADPEGRLYGLPSWARMTGARETAAGKVGLGQCWEERMKTPIFPVPTVGQLLDQLEDFTVAQAEEDGTPAGDPTVAQVHAAYQAVVSKITEATAAFRVPERTAQRHLDWMDQLAMDVSAGLDTGLVRAVLAGTRAKAEAGE